MKIRDPKLAEIHDDLSEKRDFKSCDFWNHREKCIQIITNMHSIGFECIKALNLKTFMAWQNQWLSAEVLRITCFLSEICTYSHLIKSEIWRRMGLL